MQALVLQWLQHALWERHRVRSPRLTLAEIAERGSLDPSGNLTVDGQLVAVAYFRAGYAPTDYPSDTEWQARWVLKLMSSCMERRRKVSIRGCSN